MFGYQRSAAVPPVNYGHDTAIPGGKCAECTNYQGRLPVTELLPLVISCISDESLIKSSCNCDPGCRIIVALKKKKKSEAGSSCVVRLVKHSIKHPTVPPEILILTRSSHEKQFLTNSCITKINKEPEVVRDSRVSDKNRRPADVTRPFRAGFSVLAAYWRGLHK